MRNSAFAKAMTTDERQPLIDEFERLATTKPDTVSDEWKSLLGLLELPLDCFLAVHEVLKQGRWRTSKNPRGYVRCASMVEARKMDPNKPRKNEPLVFMPGDVIDKGGDPEGIGVAIREESRKIGKAPLPPMKGRHRSLDQIDWDREHSHKEKMIAESRPVLPRDFFIEQKLCVREKGQLIPVGTYYEHNWGRWAREAGLDSVQLKVIEYRRREVSREAALSEQPDEVSRKALQAAWKRFDRTGKEKLKEFVEKCNPSVPDEHFQDTKRIGGPTPVQSSIGLLVPESQRAIRAAFERRGDKTREGLGRFLSHYRAGWYAR